MAETCCLHIYYIDTLSSHIYLAYVCMSSFGGLDLSLFLVWDCLEQTLHLTYAQMRVHTLLTARTVM